MRQSSQRKENTRRLGSRTIYSFTTTCFAVKQVSLLPPAVSLRAPGGVHPRLKIELGIMKCHGDRSIRAGREAQPTPLLTIPWLCSGACPLTCACCHFLTCTNRGCEYGAQHQCPPGSLWLWATSSPRRNQLQGQMWVFQALI